jgi:hypothetical protein
MKGLQAPKSAAQVFQPLKKYELLRFQIDNIIVNKISLHEPPSSSGSTLIPFRVGEIALEKTQSGEKGPRSHHLLRFVESGDFRDAIYAVIDPQKLIQLQVGLIDINISNENA